MAKKNPGEFNVTSKLRLQDYLKWNPNARSIHFLIQNHPTELWNIIHGKTNFYRKVSLVRPAYAALKTKVLQIEPSLVEEVENKRKKLKALQRLKKELTNGKSVNHLGRFKKISSQKVID